jgi:membrane protein
MTQAPQDISGHDATEPSQFSWPAWKAVLGRVWVRIYRDHLSIIAAGVAFFGILAIFPSIAALIGLYGMIADPSHVASNLLAVRPLLPPDVYRLIEDQVVALIASRQKLGIASLLALLFALWSARAGVAALVEGLNIVYREYDDRSFLVQYLLSLVLTFLLLVFGVFALSVIVAVPTMLHFSDFGPVGPGSHKSRRCSCSASP